MLQSSNHRSKWKGVSGTANAKHIISVTEVDGVDLSKVRTQMTWSLGCNRTKLKSQTSFHNCNWIRAVQEGNRLECTDMSSDYILRS